MEGDAAMTNDKALAIKKIYQKDNFTFSIEWMDGNVSSWRLSDLQLLCPCASCVDETTGERLVSAHQIDPGVKARRIASVGRYALAVEFTKGCSAGIYSFDMLKK